MSTRELLIKNAQYLEDQGASSDEIQQYLDANPISSSKLLQPKQKEEVKEPGLISKIAGETVRPFEKVGLTVFSGLDKLLGTKGYEEMQEGSLAKRLTGKKTEKIKSLKDLVGTGLEIGATAVPVGKIGTIGKAGYQFLKRGAATGGLAGGGIALQEEGSKTSDVIKGAAGGALIGTGFGLATKGLVKGAIGTKKVVTTSGRELQTEALRKGLYGLNESIGSLGKKFDDVSYTYINPENVKVKVNPIDTMIEYNLIPRPGKSGSIDISEIKERLPSLHEELEDKISSTFKTSNKTINFEDYIKSIETAMGDLKKSKLEKENLLEELIPKLKNLNKAYPDGQIPFDEINKIRKESNKKYRDLKVDIDRVIGNATRDIVYNTTDDKSIKNLLNEQRKLINVEDYTNKLSLHKVKGGRLGNYVFSTLGAIVGAGTKLPFGVGEFTGALGGRALSEGLQRRQFKSLPGDIKVGVEKLLGKSKK